MASPPSPLLITSTSTSKPAAPLIAPLLPASFKPPPAMVFCCGRRDLALSIVGSTGGLLMSSLVVPLQAAWAAGGGVDEEYVKETTEVIGKVRYAINMPKTDPNVAAAVAEMRYASNSWVAKYRREKDLLGRPSFRDMYSALNAVSGHYISFGPTAPIPAKRKARILEEVDTAEKALLRGR